MEDQKEIIEGAGDSSIAIVGMDVSASNQSPHFKPGIIYKATNLINGRVYVGKTICRFKQRMANHISAAKSKRRIGAFHNAINKYGAENFKWEIIDQCLLPDMLCELEKKYIEQFNCKTPNGYNMTDGGEGMVGYVPSKETKKKRSISMAGKTPSRLAITNSIIVRKGKSLSLEHIQKLREAKLGKVYRMGFSLSDETKRKISQTKKGVPWTQKRRDAQKLRK
jgi:group I intron endonuclease